MRVLTADEEIRALTLKIVPNEPPKGSQDETRSNSEEDTDVENESKDSTRPATGDEEDPENQGSGKGSTNEGEPPAGREYVDSDKKDNRSDEAPPEKK